MIKRVITILLALMLVLSLAACGEDKPAEKAPEEKAETQDAAATAPVKLPEEKPEEKGTALEPGSYEADYHAAAENDGESFDGYVVLDLFPEGAGVLTRRKSHDISYDGVLWDGNSLSIEGKPVEYSFDGEKISFEYQGAAFDLVKGLQPETALGEKFGDDFTGTYYAEDGRMAVFESDGTATLIGEGIEKHFFWGSSQILDSFVIIDGVLTGLEWENRYGKAYWSDDLELIKYYIILFAPDNENEVAFSTLEDVFDSQEQFLEIYKAPGEGDLYASVNFDNIADASQWFTADSENSMTIYKGDYSDPSAVLVIYGSENDESAGYGDEFLEALVSAGVDYIIGDNENVLDSTPEYMDMNGGNKACGTTCLYQEEGVSYIGYVWAWIVGNNAYYMLGIAYYDSDDYIEMNKIANEILDTFMTAQEYLDAGNTAP